MSTTDDPVRRVIPATYRRVPADTLRPLLEAETAKMIEQVVEQWHREYDGRGDFGEAFATIRSDGFTRHAHELVEIIISNWDVFSDQAGGRYFAQRRDGEGAQCRGEFGSVLIMIGREESPRLSTAAAEPVTHHYYVPPPDFGLDGFREPPVSRPGFWAGLMSKIGRRNS